MTSYRSVDMNKSIEEKEAALSKRRATPKADVDTIKFLNKKYLRIYKKIQYHSDSDHRYQKIMETMERNRTNREVYNVYQRDYHAKRKLNVVC